MKCEEVSEWLGAYRDLPEMSPERLALESHIAGCPDCKEEFRLWEESTELIRQLPLIEDAARANDVSSRINRDVMNRIYAEQSWFMPAVRKTYTFTNGFRMKIAVMLAGLLTLFGTAFLYTAWNRISGGDNRFVGVMEATNAIAIDNNSGIQTMLVPVASLSDPIVLAVTPAMPEYWVALSLFGMIMMLLILNWFSRVRT